MKNRAAGPYWLQVLPTMFDQALAQLKLNWENLISEETKNRQLRRRKYKMAIWIFNKGIDYVGDTTKYKSSHKTSNECDSYQQTERRNTFFTFAYYLTSKQMNSQLEHKTKITRARL